MTMNWITIIWSMVASACLTLAVMHWLVWYKNRTAWASLAFAVAATGVAGTAAGEFMLMRALTPEEFAAALRWANGPVTLMVVGIVWFVHAGFRTGRGWLAWLAVGLRLLTLILHFTSGATAVHRSITSLRQIEFLGQPVSVVDEAVASPWAFMPWLSNLVLLVFVADASVRLWRSGGHQNRSRALRVGGGILGFLLVVSVFNGLINHQVIHAPYLVSLPFLAIVLVMNYELSRDLLRSIQLSRELQDSESHLRESERRLTLAAAASDLGLWFWNLQDNTLWATGRAKETFGFPPEKELTLDRFLACLHPEDRPLVEATMAESIAHRQNFQSKFRILSQDGEMRWVDVRGELTFAEEGKPISMTGVVADITERRRANLEMQELRDELTHSGRVTLLGQLASALAHELSQPLGAILRNAEAAELMLQEPDLDLEELRAIVTDIREDDRRAGNVINRLRSLLKRGSLDPKPINLETVITDVVTLVHNEATARAVKLEVAVAPNLPVVRGDRVHLQQVLLNLIVNAMDALNESPADRRRININASCADADTVEISVSDFGPGVPAETLKRLFEPFFTTKANGMGMGLPMSKTIIEAHHGRIWAENHPEGGAVLRFTVPIAREGFPA